MFYISLSTDFRILNTFFSIVIFLAPVQGKLKKFIRKYVEFGR